VLIQLGIARHIEAVRKDENGGCPLGFKDPTDTLNWFKVDSPSGSQQVEDHMAADPKLIGEPVEEAGLPARRWASQEDRSTRSSLAITTARIGWGALVYRPKGENSVLNLRQQGRACLPLEEESSRDPIPIRYILRLTEESPEDLTCLLRVQRSKRSRRAVVQQKADLADVPPLLRGQLKYGCWAAGCADLQRTRAWPKKSGPHPLKLLTLW